MDWVAISAFALLIGSILLSDHPNEAWHPLASIILVIGIAFLSWAGLRAGGMISSGF